MNSIIKNISKNSLKKLLLLSVMGLSFISISQAENSEETTSNYVAKNYGYVAPVGVNDTSTELRAWSSAIASGATTLNQDYQDCSKSKHKDLEFMLTQINAKNAELLADIEYLGGDIDTLNSSIASANNKKKKSTNLAIGFGAVTAAGVATTAIATTSTRALNGAKDLDCNKCAKRRGVYYTLRKKACEMLLTENPKCEGYSSACFDWINENENFFKDIDSLGKDNKKGLENTDINKVYRKLDEHYCPEMDVKDFKWNSSPNVVWKVPSGYSLKGAKKKYTFPFACPSGTERNESGICTAEVVEPITYPSEGWCEKQNGTPWYFMHDSSNISINPITPYNEGGKSDGLKGSYTNNFIAPVKIKKGAKIVGGASSCGEVNYNKNLAKERSKSLLNKYLNKYASDINITETEIAACKVGGKNSSYYWKDRFACFINGTDAIIDDETPDDEDDETNKCPKYSTFNKTKKECECNEGYTGEYRYVLDPPKLLSCKKKSTSNIVEADCLIESEKNIIEGYADYFIKAQMSKSYAKQVSEKLIRKLIPRSNNKSDPANINCTYKTSGLGMTLFGNDSIKCSLRMYPNENRCNGLDNIEPGVTNFYFIFDDATENNKKTSDENYRNYISRINKI